MIPVSTSTGTPLDIAVAEDGSYVLARWQQVPSSAAFRQEMNRIIEALRESGAGKLLTDTRQLGLLEEADQQWSVEDWLPCPLETNYRAIAIVVPEDVFAHMTVEMVMDEVTARGITVQQCFFANEAEAKAWLADL